MESGDKFEISMNVKMKPTTPTPAASKREQSNFIEERNVTGIVSFILNSEDVLYSSIHSVKIDTVNFNGIIPIR